MKALRRERACTCIPALDTTRNLAVVSGNMVRVMKPKKEFTLVDPGPKDAKWVSSRNRGNTSGLMDYLGSHLETDGIGGLFFQKSTLFARPCFGLHGPCGATQLPRPLCVLRPIFQHGSGQSPFMGRARRG